MSALIPFNRRRNALRAQSFDDLYSLFDNFFSDWPGSRLTAAQGFHMDIQQCDDHYCIEAELPGVKKEDISLSLDDGHLRICVNKEEVVDEKRQNYVHRERRFGTMQRSVYLADAKPDDIEAKFKDGVLTINVPIDKNRATSRQIQIQ